MQTTINDLHVLDFMGRSWAATPTSHLHVESLTAYGGHTSDFMSYIELLSYQHDSGQHISIIVMSVHFSIFICLESSMSRIKR